MQTGVFSAPRTERVQSTEWEGRSRESGVAANTARQRGREQPSWFLQRCFKPCEKNQSPVAPSGRDKQSRGKTGWALCRLCSSMWNTVGTLPETRRWYLYRNSTQLALHSWWAAYDAPADASREGGCWCGYFTATANSTSTAQCRHSCWKLCAGSIRDDSVQHKNAPRAVHWNWRKWIAGVVLAQQNQCAYDICLPERHRSVLGGQRAHRDSPHHTITWQSWEVHVRTITACRGMNELCVTMRRELLGTECRHYYIIRAAGCFGKMPQSMWKNMNHANVWWSTNKIFFDN